MITSQQNVARKAAVKMGLLRSKFIAQVHDITSEVSPDSLLTELETMFSEARDVVMFHRAMNE